MSGTLKKIRLFLPLRQLRTFLQCAANDPPERFGKPEFYPYVYWDTSVRRFNQANPPIIASHQVVDCNHGGFAYSFETYERYHPNPTLVRSLAVTHENNRLDILWCRDRTSYEWNHVRIPADTIPKAARNHFAGLFEKTGLING